MRCGVHSAGTLWAWAKWRAAHIGWTAAVVVACGGGAAAVWSVLPAVPAAVWSVLPAVPASQSRYDPAVFYPSDSGLEYRPAPVPVPAPGGLAVLPAVVLVLLWRRRV